MAKEFDFRQFIDGLGEDSVSIAVDGKSSAEFSGYVDTGSYILNAAFCGSMFGGFPDNKALVLAGESSVGKSFFALSLVKQFLAANPKAKVFYFDTESAVTNQMLIERGIDLNRFVKVEPSTLEAFRNIAFKIVDKFEKLDVDQRFPALLVLDSLSALPSEKEVTDTTAGANTRDMTKAPIIKGIFRVLRLKLAKLQIPLIVTSHVYTVVGAYVPTKETSGGSGVKYAADQLVFLSKTAEKDDKTVIGSIVTAVMQKSRLTKEKTKVHTRIQFDGGLDRYYGLMEYAIVAGIVVKDGTRVRFPDGTKAFEKAVNKNPTKFWTNDVLKTLDAWLQTAFRYQASAADEEDEDGDTDITETND